MNVSGSVKPFRSLFLTFHSDCRMAWLVGGSGRFLATSSKSFAAAHPSMVEVVKGRSGANCRSVSWYSLIAGLSR